jgi:predicted transcriptional regulator
MDKTQLENCLAVLQVLKKQGRLNAAEIESSAKISHSLLGECFAILTEEGMLVEEANSEPVYRITENGEKALAFFKLNQVS